MISTVVLTLNEERDLPQLLKSLGWCDDVHVVDAGSTDKTLELAKAAGARCYSHTFDSFGEQRNWALEQCPFRHPWILFLDADEVATPAFVEALKAAILAADERVAGFYCCWKTMLNDRWLKRSDAFPKWQFRVLHQGRARFTDFGHGQREQILTGRAEYLTEPYLHYTFSKGWHAWIARHNRYSDLEAAERMGKPGSWRAALRSNASDRNKELKLLLGSLPGWPLLRFMADYFLRGGFLEGKEGFTYCVNMAIYEWMIQIKMAEKKRAAVCR